MEETLGFHYQLEVGLYALFRRTAWRSEGISTLVPKDHKADDEMQLVKPCVRLVDLLNHI